MNSKELLREALSLSARERADLAHDLLDSLEGAPDADVESTWVAEIEKRVRDLNDGSVVPVEWEEARKRIHDRLHGSRS